jgi:hypothetical protein
MFISEVRDVNIEFIDSDFRRHTITVKVSFVAGENKINSRYLQQTDVPL